MNTGTFRNFKNGFQTVNGGEQQPKKPKKGAGIVVAMIVLAIVVVIVGWNSAYEIKEQEQAVLITLGRAQAVTEPGLHFKIPFIQQVRKVNTTIQGFSIGYSTDNDEVNEDESLMITSDFNFIDVDFYVEFSL